MDIKLETAPGQEEVECIEFYCVSDKPFGLHLSTAGRLARGVADILLKGAEAEIKVSEHTANASSILGVMSLRIAEDMPFTITLKGPAILVHQNRLSVERLLRGMDLLRRHTPRVVVLCTLRIRYAVAQFA